MESPLSQPHQGRLRQKNTAHDFFSDVFRFTIIALAIVLPVRAFIAQPFIVSGASMDPTFADGQYLIVDELTYHFHEPERGDVIIFRFPKDTSKFFIKRIIGLPGDTVELRNTSVIISNAAYPNGFILKEPYIAKNTPGFLSITLNTDEYFVLGDNRPESSDSRSWGSLPRTDLVGRALFRLLPINRINVFPGTYHQEE